MTITSKYSVNLREQYRRTYRMAFHGVTKYARRQGQRELPALREQLRAKGITSVRLSDHPETRSCF